MHKLAENVTQNTTGQRHAIRDGRLYAIAIQKDAVFDGATVTIRVWDAASDNELYTDSSLYSFTSGFDAFELTLCPGMSISADVSDAGASTNITGVYLYKAED